MFTVVVGSDRALIVLAKSIHEKNLPGIKTLLLQEDTTKEVADQFLQADMFSSYSGYSLSGLESVPKDEHKSLLKIVATCPLPVWVYLMGDTSKQVTLTKEVEKLGGTVELLPALGEAQKKQWLRDLESEIGTTLPAPVERLLLGAPGDGVYFQGLAETLLLLACQRPVAIEDFRALVPSTLRELDFALLDALMSGQVSAATRVIAEAPLGGDAGFKFLGLLVWQMRQILLLKSAHMGGIRDSRAAASAVGAKPFVAQKLWGMVGRVPLTTLQEVYSSLALVDRRIKLGSPLRTELLLLIPKFTQLTQ